MAHNGHFSNAGAYRRDAATQAAERQRAEQEQQKVADYRARVVGRRVMVMSDLDFGKCGTIVDVVDGMLAVQLEGEAAPQFFDRYEIEATR